MASSQQNLAATTLDEPILTTIWRDVRRVGVKLFHVLIPRGKSDKALRDWDLWGPLVFCLVFAVLMSNMALQLFVLIWIGSATVTLNAQLLGGKISFFQCVCVLGYCVFPLLLACIAIYFIFEFYNHVAVRLGVAAGGFVWSTAASIGFMAGLVPADRKALAVYPVFLFYLVLSWMVVVNFS